MKKRDDETVDAQADTQVTRGGFSGAAVEILVDRDGRVFFLDLPPELVPVARALDPASVTRQTERQDTADVVRPSRTSNDAKR